MKTLLLTILISQIAFADYSRSSFKHWINEDGDCLNTRQEVLQKESLTPPKIENCRVVEGKWYDIYSGEYYTNPSELDIDHIVPLKEAWESGADKWTAEKRKQFANDYDNLIAVDRSLNRQKGAKDPAQWLPPRKEYICEYIIRWIHIKVKYTLEMDAKEQRKVEEIQVIIYKFKVDKLI